MWGALKEQIVDQVLHKASCIDGKQLVLFVYMLLKLDFSFCLENIDSTKELRAL